MFLCTELVLSMLAFCLGQSEVNVPGNYFFHVVGAFKQGQRVPPCYRQRTEVLEDASRCMIFQNNTFDFLFPPQELENIEEWQIMLYLTMVTAVPLPATTQVGKILMPCQKNSTTKIPIFSTQSQEKIGYTTVTWIFQDSPPSCDRPKPILCLPILSSVLQKGKFRIFLGN